MAALSRRPLRCAALRLPCTGTAAPSLVCDLCESQFTVMPAALARYTACDAVLGRFLR